MSIGFTGTQIGLSLNQKQTLRDILEKFKGVESKFHHGDCIGADSEANQIAKDLGYQIVLHPPILKHKRSFCKADISLPPKDYLDRNKDIAKCCKLLLACPKEFSEMVRSGTWSTVRYARKFKKDIIIIYPDGSLSKELFSK